MSLNDEQQKAVSELRETINHYAKFSLHTMYPLMAPSEAVIRELEQAQRERDEARRELEELKGEEWISSAEVGVFQDRVRNELIRITGCPDSQIDGKGSDSGWEDFTLAEIGQALAFVIDQRDDLRAKLDATEASGAEMRELLDYIDKHIVSPFLLQGECECILDDGPCCYCASSHANKAILALSTTHGQSFLAERERHVRALEEIAGYGEDGICPYGCDCPNIARTALNPK